jgi:hypothetical protein
LEDLNIELEKLQLCHDDYGSITKARTFYCNIFSRQSQMTDEDCDECSSPEFHIDDEGGGDENIEDIERIKFRKIPDNGNCELIEIIPRKPNLIKAIPSAIYQPCTNNIQILKSSENSAFREISDAKISESSASTLEGAVKEEEEEEGEAAAAAGDRHQESSQ